jgi:hypothetical protein
MEPNEKSEQRRVVIDRPGTRREVITERTQRAPKEGGLSTGVIALVAVLVVGFVGVVLYVVSNRNANESANRNANIEVASRANEAPPPTVIQQPAPAPQAPVIIQQPAQPAPVIIQQSAPSGGVAEDISAKDDAALQEAAEKILLNEPDMGSVSITVSSARAALTGTANSESTKERAERLVKSVRGVKSVDNKIYVAGA